ASGHATAAPPSSVMNSRRLDAGDVLTDLAVRPGKAGAIAHQAASLGIFAPRVGGRHCIARRERNQLRVPAIEEWIGADEQCLNALLTSADECRLEFSLDSGSKSEQQQSSCLHSRFHVPRVLPIGNV